MQQIFQEIKIDTKGQGFYNFTISLNYLSKKIENYLKNKKQKINLKYIVENKTANLIN